MGVVSMRERVSAAALCAVLAVAGCTAADGPATGTSGTSSGGLAAPATAAPLVPTSARAVAWGYLGSGSVVTDGTGAVWVRGPDSLTRYDPATGGATTWGPSDDLAFAAAIGVAPSATGGVWLASPSRLRRFDGATFTRVIDLPGTFGVTPEHPVASLVEQGDAVWVTNDRDVTARWADGAWTRLPEARGGPLLVDASGALWAGGRSSETSTFEVARWDGAAWTRPGEGAASLPGSAYLVGMAADRAGGVWLVEVTQPVEGTGQATLWHWDGSRWASSAVPAAAGPVGVDTVLTTTPAGDVWVGGTGGVARYSTSAGWAVVGRAQGLSPDVGAVGVAASGADVYVGTGAGLYLVRGGRAARVWAAVAPGPTNVSAVVAVSADEVWAKVGPIDPPTAWWRWRDGRWGPLGLPAGRGEDGIGGGVLATDGAVWLDTAAGLVRVSGDTATVMSASASRFVSPAAGPEGSVYVVEGASRVVQVHPDGRRTNLGVPADPSSSSPAGVELWALAAGPDGTVWATSGGFSAPFLWQWRDGWRQVALPDGVTAVTGLAVAGDGHLWLAADAASGGRVARFAEGAWTSYPATAWHLAAAPDGSVCASGGATCYSALGPARALAPDVQGGDIAVAPDGALWLLGETLLRVTRVTRVTRVSP